MGLVKTRRLAAMHPPSPSAYAEATADRWLRRTGKQQRAILLRQGYGGLKAGMKLPTPKPARKCAPFPQHPSKPPHTKALPPNL